MKHHTFAICLLVFALVGAGCSSQRAAKESKKPAPPPDKIQGKTQIMDVEQTTADDAAMNAGGPTVYLIDGMRRYRLFFHTPAKVEPGKEYIVEGVYAQKAIDEIGDPDQGKNGYPLESSCDAVVQKAWPGLAFDLADAHASVLRAKIKRHPARPVFLVMRLQPAPESKKEAESADLPEVTVPAEKQRAALIEGPVVQPAPLWEPKGDTVRCKVVIDEKGKVSDLETGTQLCEAVPWSQFRYQPPVQRGKPVRVKTEVEVKFEPRK